MRRHRSMRWWYAVALVVVLGASGCGTRHHLGRYDFAGRTVAIVHVTPTSGDLRMGSFSAERGDPVGALVAAGSRLAVEVEARRVRARLDSAAARVVVGTRMADRTAERATMYLGARRVPAPSSADYVLDLRVRSYGVSARDWQSAAQLYLEADVVLLDAATGVEIWTTRVNGWDAITPRVASSGDVPRDIITAAGLLTVSVEDLERTLQRVVDVSADAVTDELREKLRDVRRDQIARR
ncbi:MAG TPA: hypothetical protein VK933_00915 [Longimicrobiales bacterium]|nr:hypothetical protein [Longimicrobiales bacterium]